MQWKPTKRYMMAIKALYGTKRVDPPKDTAEERSLRSGQKNAVKRDIKGKVVPTEQQEQFVTHAWLAKCNIRHHHSPNGGYRDVREATKFKRLGTSAGFPDIFIPYPRKGYHGLFIELKRRSGGKLSEEQIEWGKFLIARGYAWFEAKGFDEVEKIVKEYFA